MDAPEVKARHSAMVGHAWRLIGEWHRRALRVHRACAGDVYLLNPMGGGANLIFRILPEAISIAMKEADVPKGQRAETRGIVKLLHAIDADASGVDMWGLACFASGTGREKPQEWRDVCPPKTFGCKCSAWFDGYGGGD